MTEVIDALRECAMKARINIRRLGLSRKDKDTTEEVRSDKGVAERGVLVSVNRMAGADEMHKRLVGIQEEMRRIFIRRTMYWDDSGWRIMPSEQFMPLLKAMSPLKQRHKEALEEYEEKLPDILAAARQGVGRTGVQVPTESEVIGSYVVDVTFEDISEGSTFPGLPPAVQVKLRESMAKRAEQAREEAVQDKLRVILPVAERIADRLKAYEARLEAIAKGENVGRNGVFRDTLAESVTELAATLPSFNVLGDPVLAKAIERIVTMAKGTTSDGLRADPLMRERVLAQAEELRELVAPHVKVV